MTLWPRLRAWWQRRRQRRLERRLQRQRRNVARIEARFRAYQADAKARGVEVSGWGELIDSEAERGAGQTRNA